MNIEKRVQRGLKWLREKGPGRGLQLSSVVAQRSELDVRRATNCVLSLATGQPYPERRNGYLDIDKSTEWLWRHGFESKDDDPGDVYDRLTDEWRRVLAE